MSWISIARSQYGLISRRQFVALGLSAATPDQLLRTGRLESTVHRGVYRVAGAPVSGESASWLAVLGTRSPLSYVSAAAFWELDAPGDRLLHVTRPGRCKINWPPGVRVHRVGLARSAITERYGLLTTTKVETALDCMAWLPAGQALRFADRAVQQGWVGEDDVKRRLSEQTGRWGNSQLRRILPLMSDGAAAESERRLHKLLRSAGVTGWAPNLSVLVGGQRFVIDVAFLVQRVAIEIDGFDYHRRDRFQRDRTKQNALIRAGWTVLRFTWSDIVERPEYVLVTIAELLVASPGIA